MEVEYSVRPEDFKAFAEFHKRNKPKPQRSGNAGRVGSTPGELAGNLLWVLILALLVIWLLVQSPQPRRQGQPPEKPEPSILLQVPALLVGFAAGVVAFVLYSKSLHARARRQLFADDRNRWKVGPRRLRISPEGLSTIGDYHTSFCAWSIICSVGATRDHIFLYDGPATAHAVPRRAFAHEGDFEAFYDLLCRYRAEYPPPQMQRATGITTIPNVLPVSDIQKRPL
jgi:hypothetical protein